MHVDSVYYMDAVRYAEAQLMEDPLVCSLQKMYQRCCRLQTKASNHGCDEPFCSNPQKRMCVDSAFVDLVHCAEAQLMEDPLVLLSEDVSDVL